MSEIMDAETGRYKLNQLDEFSTYFQRYIINFREDTLISLNEDSSWAHEAMDPYRHTGYDLVRLIKGTNS